MVKTRCKKKKEKEVTDAKFQCHKCKQVAKKKKELCQPEKL
jgi:hypothetical protein